MIKLRTFCAVSIALIGVTQGSLAAQEKKIQRSELPPAVEKTVVEQSAGAQVKGFSQEVENGQTIYEVEMMVDSHGKDLVIDASGAVVAVEEEVLFEVLPAVVKLGILNFAGKNKVLKVESITKDGKLTGYEAQVAKKGEVLVGTNGKPIKKS